MDTSSLVTARLRRRVPVLVCRKCLKRAPEGGAARKALKQALKQRGKEQGNKPRLIMTSCFGICPKRAIVAASGATLAHERVLVISDATSAGQAAAHLLADGPPR